MTNKEAVNWIINLSADIGKSEHRELRHYEQALYEIMEILESAQPGWIPVTERLPKTSDPVLVTYIFHGDRLFTGTKIIREVATANYYNEAWFPHDCEFYYELVDVIAWMPLPEPYKVGEQV